MTDNFGLPPRESPEELERDRKLREVVSETLDRIRDRIARCPACGHSYQQEADKLVEKLKEKAKDIQ